MEPGNKHINRDCAPCAFANFFNGLRESCVMYIQFPDVIVAVDDILACLYVVKMRSASRQLLVMYHRLARTSSPIDLFRKWVGIHGSHKLFFFGR